MEDGWPVQRLFYTLHSNAAPSRPGSTASQCFQSTEPHALFSTAPSWATVFTAPSHGLLFNGIAKHLASLCEPSWLWFLPGRRVPIIASPSATAVRPSPLEEAVILHSPIDFLREISILCETKPAIGHHISVDVPSIGIRRSQWFVARVARCCRGVPPIGTIPARKERWLECLRL